jgi:tetratricopeptide (TPR) repeat protein
MEFHLGSAGWLTPLLAISVQVAFSQDLYLASAARLEKAAAACSPASGEQNDATCKLTITELRSLVNANPNRPEAVALLAESIWNSALQAGERQESIDLYRRAVRLAPRDPRLKLDLGVRLDDPEERLRLFREAVSVQPANAEAHDALASLLLSYKKDLEGAYKEYAAYLGLVELSAESTLSSVNFAVRLAQAGGHEEAARLLEQILQRANDPPSHLCYFFKEVPASAYQDHPTLAKRLSDLASGCPKP